MFGNAFVPIHNFSETLVENRGQIHIQTLLWNVLFVNINIKGKLER